MDIALSLLGLGLLLGIRHAFDADHIAAVSAMVARHKSIKKSSLLGALWGFGHTISLFAVGLMVLLLKIPIPERIALYIEFIVGIMLVALGLNVLMAVNKEKSHLHKHTHGGKEHIHFHSHKYVKEHHHGHASFRQSMLVGLIHGLAGSAALTLLVLTAISSIWLGLLYILMVGVGTLIGMTLISAIISLPFTLIPAKLEKIQKLLKLSAGLISIMIGLIIVT